MRRTEEAQAVQSKLDELNRQEAALKNKERNRAT
jgi:hypothetical protein